MNRKTNSLIEAAKQGDVLGVNDALDAGENPNARDADGRNALHWASQEGHLSIAERLMSARTDAKAQDELGFTPLELAVGEGHEDLVRVLVAAGASPDVRNPANGHCTSLHLACSWNRFEIARTLLEAGSAEINPRDDEGKTPLGFALDGQFQPLIQYLKRHGAVT